MSSGIRATVVSEAPDAGPLVELARPVVTWERPPSSWSGGRAGWIVVPAEVPCGRSKGLKLKGLGVPPSDGRAASIPSCELYDRWGGQPSDPHFGIGDDGEFCLRSGDPAPVGGLLESSARREQRCSAALAAAGVPAVTPVAAFRYDDLELRHGDVRRPLAVSVTASPLPQDVRCAAVVPFGGWRPRCDADASELQRLDQVLGVRSASDAPRARLMILRRVYEELGVTLRSFADAGWYRYSGHPGNVTINDRGRALLVDLDSCRDMAAIGHERAALEAVRDGMSALYNLSCIFYSPEAMRSVDDQTLVDHEPFSGFLAGWDPDADPGTHAADGRAIARYVVAARRGLRHFAPFLESDSPAAAHLYRYVRHDRDVTFTWIFRLLARRRLQRPGTRPLPMGLSELDNRLRRFAGYERFEMVMAWEAEC